MPPVIVQIKRLANGQNLPLPMRMTEHAAGFDIAAAVEAPTVLLPGEIKLIACGFALAVPAGFEAQVRPRSGLSSKHGVTMINAPGTIDADYRGEVAVVLINLGDAPFRVERGMRIAQLVVAPVATVRWQEMARLSGTARAGGGFGSTGTDLAAN